MTLTRSKWICCINCNTASVNHDMQYNKEKSLLTKVFCLNTGSITEKIGRQWNLHSSLIPEMPYLKPVDGLGSAHFVCPHRSSFLKRLPCYVQHSVDIMITLIMVVGIYCKLMTDIKLDSMRAPWKLSQNSSTASWWLAAVLNPLPQSGRVTKLKENFHEL